MASSSGPCRIFGIDVKLLDPTIAMPKFAKLAAAALQKQQAAEQKARQIIRRSNGKA